MNDALHLATLVRDNVQSTVSNRTLWCLPFAADSTRLGTNWLVGFRRNEIWFMLCFAGWMEKINETLNVSPFVSWCPDCRFRTGRPTCLPALTKKNRYKTCRYDVFGRQGIGCLNVCPCPSTVLFAFSLVRSLSRIIFPGPNEDGWYI